MLKIGKSTKFRKILKEYTHHKIFFILSLSLKNIISEEILHCVLLNQHKNYRFEFVKLNNIIFCKLFSKEKKNNLIFLCK